MKKIISIFLLSTTSAFAYVATPAEIHTECVRQMAAGVCTTKPSQAPEAGQSMIIAGVGRIDMRAWYDYASLFNEANPQDPAMCELALVKTTSAPGSDHDLYARAVWTPIKPEKQDASYVKPLLETSLVSGLLLAFVGFWRRSFSLRTCNGT